MPDLTEEISIPERDARANIGRVVIYAGLLAIGVLGMAALIVVGLGLTKGSDQLQGVKDILSILLPVIGAWVGTVLAFYFARENFAVASDKAAQLVRQLTPDQKLESIPVVDAMIRLEKAAVLKLDGQQKDSDVNIKAAILERLTAANANRLPVVEQTGVVRYVIHRSVFDRFLTERALAEPGAKIDALTLADMLAEDRYRKLATAFEAVSRGARLREVKAKMDADPDCSDVVVTEDGGKKSRAIGWITNVIVTEKAKL